jgi:exopolysaccharide biosynthesis polyprenyl glycosylphosphotransferase
MLRDHSRELHSAVLSGDLLLSALIFGVLVSLPGMAPGASGYTVFRLLALGLAASLVWPLAFQQLGLYGSQRRLGAERILARLLVAGLAALFVESAVAFSLSVPVAPSFPALCAAVQLAGLTALRLSVYGALRWLRRGGHNTRNVLVVGSGPRAAYVQEVVHRNPAWGLRIIGFIDDGPPEGGASIDEEDLHKLADMRDLLRDEVIDEVIVACPRSMLSAIVDVVDACAAAGVPITLLSDIFGDYLPPPQVRRFGSLPALNFAPVHHSRVALAAKRAIDAAGAVVLLAATAAVLAAAMLAVRLTSSGPVLFRQLRCGLNGRTFEMLKLRTMYADAEDRRSDLTHLNEMEGPVFKIRDDPRVTPVGRVLRRFSIDELPQLWNVLRGDMSLVGPRPSLPSEVVEYQTFERRRLSMRPGLTCIWQVSGRNEIDFEDWVRLDLEYIDTWSLGQDWRIMLQTLPAVIRGDGAS